MGESVYLAGRDTLSALDFLGRLVVVFLRAAARPRRWRITSTAYHLEQMGLRRKFALALVGVITAANVVALIALIASLLNAEERSGGELLLKGATIWSTNVITFGLLFWEVDRGGPIRRLSSDPPPRDFQFPQDENPTLAEPNWLPRLSDYIYISYTNSIAFSPTDSMPLKRRASSEAVASSRIMMGASRINARAMEIRCRWPPDNRTPRSPTRVS